MKTHPEFNKKYGLLTASKLLSPTFHPVDALELPKDSVVHYTPETEYEFGPDQIDPIFNGRDSSFVWHIEELTAVDGNPKARRSSINKAIRDFHRKNRKLRVLRNLEQGLRFPQNIVVYNYSLLQHVYQYRRSALTGWYSWSNVNRTVWDTVKKSTEDLIKNAFIQIRLPSVFPTREQLKRLDKKVDLAGLEAFANNEALMFFYLWQWASTSDHELDKMFSGPQAEKVNLLFINGGHFVSVNFAQLQSWKVDALGSAEDGQLFATRWIQFLTKVHELGTTVEVTDEEDEDVEIDLINNPNADDRALATSKKALEAMENGNMSVPEYNRAVKLASRYKDIKNPSGEGTLEDLLSTEDELKEVSSKKINDIESVLDKTMLNMVTRGMDRGYIDNVMEADIARSILGVQNSGVAVTDFKRETVTDVSNSYDHYSIQLTPVNGAASTVHFKIPKVDDEGKFLANGVNYTMAKQRGDLPIRKTGPARVALTSYFGKLMVLRSPRAVYSRGKWLRDSIINLGRDSEDSAVTHLATQNVLNTEVKLPLVYSDIATGISGFTCQHGEMSFNYAARESLYGEEVIKKLERKGRVICGKKGTSFVVIDESGTFYKQTLDGDDKVIGDIQELVGVTFKKEPVEMTELKIFKKFVPLGIVLSYLLGLTKVLKLSKVKYRRVPRGTRTELADNERAIVFSDETLVYEIDNTEGAMLLSGWRDFATGIRNFSIAEFDSKEVYQPVLESREMPVRFIHEMDLMSEMFIDPITDEILEKRGEPRTFEGLLMKANELLKDNRTPRETDAAYMRIKGYERFSGFIYKELVGAVRRHKHLPGSSKAKVEVNPKSVWMQILNDATTKPVKTLNPVQSLREMELVTYTGEGGRSARSMVESSRVYDPNDIGFISESTVDSSSVGINAYLSATPSFDSVRGIPRKVDVKEAGIPQLLSTSAVLSPGATNDDPKRVNFIPIQQEHGVASAGAQAMPVSTGYDLVIPHRVGKAFAVTADEDGEVLEISDKHMVVAFGKDKREKHIELGTTIGYVEGGYVPHRIITDLTKGSKFKKDHVLAWNDGYFQKSEYDEGQVRWKAGSLVNVALMEGADTLEDSCAISPRLSGELATDVTYCRNIIVDFDHGVSDLVKVGDSVDLETILCTIEDAVIANNDYFDDESNEALKQLANKNPKAKNKGVIESIEVIYNGDVADMSKSLAAIARKGDRERKARSELLGGNIASSGKVSEAINVDGTKLTMDKAVIKVYITKTLPAGVGEKGVLGNQLKTIIGRVMVGRNETVDGLPIDVIFGWASISNRIVNSPMIIGSTTVLLKKVSQHVADVYKQNKRKD